MSIKKRGQTFTAIFFIAIVIGIIVLAVTINRDDLERDGQSPDNAARNVLTEYAVQLKNTVTTILSQATTQAAFESAKNAFDAKNDYVVSYGVPTIPNLVGAKTGVGDRTKAHCNAALDALENTQEGVIKYTEAGTINNVVIQVDEITLKNGDHDNGFVVSGGEQDQDGLYVAINPMNQEVNPGDTFDVFIEVNNAVDMRGYVFEVDFDDAILEMVSVGNGDFWKNAGGLSEPPFLCIPCNTTPLGNIIGMLTGANVVSGSGDLVKMTFKAKAVGSTDITFTFAQVAKDTETYGDDGDVVLNKKTGSVVVKTGEKAAPVMQGSADGGAKIQSSFTIDGVTNEVDVPYEEGFTTSISDLRYWSLYRHIAGWVEQGVLSKIACNHLPIIMGNASNNPGECYAPILSNETVKQIMDEAQAELLTRFDGDVECSYEILCQDVHTDFLWRDPCQGQDSLDECIPWPCLWRPSEAPCVAGGCGTDVNCENPTDYAKPECQDKLMFNHTATWVYGTGLEVVATDYNAKGGITFSQNHTLKFTAQMTCVDKKYPDPVHGNLTADFKVHMYMKRGQDPDDPACPCLIGGGGGGGTAPIPSNLPVVRPHSVVHVIPNPST